MDIYRLITALVSVIAGAVIISRLLSSEFNPIALILGVAFLAFGLYRLNMAARRYAELRLGRAQGPAEEKPEDQPGRGA
ncbi:MAG: hypothetical protein M1380_02295 [Chloroflexi bacterium]|nr:hypothetical protein [Chloroflexota bacterium]